MRDKSRGAISSSSNQQVEIGETISDPEFELLMHRQVILNAFF